MRAKMENEGGEGVEEEYYEEKVLVDGKNGKRLG